ncbi:MULTISPECIES: agmatinase [unclassified Caballeronia]|uniref:agmatinase n=1 Tax=unclassified Caballeronia TaxID=2646786 RepID=UPI0020284F8C
MSEYNQPIDSSIYSRCSNIASMMRLPVATSANGLDIALWGCPFDLGLTARNGVRMGPSAVREASRYIRKVNPSTGVNPYKLANVADIGDPAMNMINQAQALKDIEDFVSDLTAAGAASICIGGDHTIPYPILRGMKAGGRIKEPLALVHIDAHADTLDTLGGERVCNATTFRRSVEDGLVDPKKTIQIGLRGTRFSEMDIAGSFELGMNVISMDEYEEMGRKAVIEQIKSIIGDSPTYITIDIDGLDPVCCPGTPSPEPGGIMMRDVQMILRSLTGFNVLGGDVCEVAPHMDPSGMTALNAANLLFEILCVTASGIDKRRK